MHQIHLAVRVRPARWRGQNFRSHHLVRLLTLLLFLVLTAWVVPAKSVHAATDLWLPTPVGERWKIIQGYGCGTHNSWDKYSLDLVHADGVTRGAPVRAAADGTIFVWVPPSGTLILKHSDGLYTMYTHMNSVVSAQLGKFVKRGTIIGAVGDREANGTPHLHFTAFTAKGVSLRGQFSVPLTFAEGYDLPDIGGCNQHHGEILIASNDAGTARPGITFETNTEKDHWYNGDQQITFSGAAMNRGFSMAWDHDPGGDGPASPITNPGSANLKDTAEGLHTLFVRGWDDHGQQMLATYGPIGVDRTAPHAPTPLTPGTVTVHATDKAALQWQAVVDEASGTAGYRVYLGTDPNGTSDWFTKVPQIETPALAAGNYILRVQALDYGGNTSPWVTLEQVVSE